MPWVFQSGIVINPGEMALVATPTLASQSFNFQFIGFDENEVRLYGVALRRLVEAAPANAGISTRQSRVLWNSYSTWTIQEGTAVGSVWMYIPVNAEGPRAVNTYRFDP